MSDYSEDVRIGDDIISGLTDSYRKLRNTMRFLLGNLNDFNESELISYSKMPELEQWILHNLYSLEQLRLKTFSEFSFQLFYKSLHDFCASDLSAFYFDVRKDSLYCDKKFSDIRRSTRTVLFHLYNFLVLPITLITEDSETAFTSNSIPSSAKSSLTNDSACVTETAFTKYVSVFHLTPLGVSVAIFTFAV